MAKEKKEIPVVLFCTSLTTAVGIKASETDEGIPSQLFNKEIIRVGRYFKDSDDIEFEVTAETLQHWVTTFSLMQTNGVKVPIPAGHDLWGDPDLNRGYVRDLFIEEGSLFATMELIGEDGIKLSKTADVSLYSPVEYTDGSGNTYQRPILHIALTPYPLIPGLKEFEAIAASLLSDKEKKKMDWAKIKASLGISDDVNDDTAEALILSAVTSLKEEDKGITDIRETNVALTKENEELKLSNSSEKPGIVLVNLAKDNISLKLSALVAGGNITPACKKKLETAIIGNDKSDKLELSLSRGGSGVVDEIISALSENDPVILGEKTPGQTLSLSDAKKSGTENSMVEEAKRRADAAAKA